MRVMFMGTPEIATNCLNALFEKHEVCCVVTKEDKPKGRSGELCCSAVKEAAVCRNIEVIQPKTLKDGRFLKVLEKYRPDVIVVVAFGLILPKYVLEFPRYGCVNLHASLLPKYRGAAPIQWCIAKGEKVSGVTTMLMDEGVDTGDILLKTEIEIPPDMTGGQLHDEFCQIGAALLLKTLDRLEKGEISPIKQDDSCGCYAPMLTKENTRIDWGKTAGEIINLIRAMNPYPGAHTSIHGKRLKVFSAEYADIKTGGCGNVLSTKQGLVVGCKDGAVVLSSLQLEGKRKMDAVDFLRGYRINEGDILG